MAFQALHRCLVCLELCRRCPKLPSLNPLSLANPLSVGVAEAAEAARAAWVARALWAAWAVEEALVLLLQPASLLALVDRLRCPVCLVCHLDLVCI